MITKKAQANLPTAYGMFRILVYTSNGQENVALVKGKIKNPALVRLHSACFTGDVFSSLKCDCGQQLKQAMRQIKKNGSGVILYLNQEGRGIGLTNKIKAYAEQEKGLDTVEANEVLGFPADARDYKIAAEILQDLGIQKVMLLTNNPDKLEQLSQYGIEIVDRIPLEIVPNKVNKAYLKTKKIKFSHILAYV